MLLTAAWKRVRGLALLQVAGWRMPVGAGKALLGGACTSILAGGLQGAAKAV